MKDKSKGVNQQSSKNLKHVEIDLSAKDLGCMVNDKANTCIKKHKKINSELPKTISNLETSDLEDDDDLILLKNKTKINKFITNLEKNNEKHNDFNSYLYEKYSLTSGYYQRFRDSACLEKNNQVFLYPNKSENITLENIEIEKEMPFIDRENSNYWKLNEDYKRVKSELETMMNNVNDYKKSIELLKHIIVVQERKLNQLNEDNKKNCLIFNEKLKSKDEEKLKYSQQNNKLKKVILNMITKLQEINSNDYIEKKG